MANKNQFTAAQFIAAIPKSAGIITTIARRVGCDWHTAKRYINDYPTINQAYRDEEERTKDMAEATVLKSIEKGETGDAKWYLSRKAKDRGYGDAKDINLGGNVALKWRDFIETKEDDITGTDSE